MGERGGYQKMQKKCDVLFEWQLNTPLEQVKSTPSVHPSYQLTSFFDSIDQSQFSRRRSIYLQQLKLKIGSDCYVIR